MVNPRRVLVLSTVLMISVLWGVIINLMSLYHGARKAEIEKNAYNLAMVAEEHAERLLSQVDGFLLEVRSQAVGDLALAEPANLLSRDKAISAFAFQLTFVSNDGWSINSSDDNHRPVYLGDRAHIRNQLMYPADDRAIMSEVLVGRVSQRPTINISRKIYDSRNAVSGIVVISLWPQYFDDLYRSLELGKAGFVGIVDSDAKIRISSNQAVGRLPTAISGGLSAGKRQILESSDFDDGVERVLAIRKLDSHPYSIIVGLGRDEQYAIHWIYNSALIFAGLFSTILLVVMIIYYGRYLDQKSTADRLRYENELTSVRKQFQAVSEAIHQIVFISTPDFLCCEYMSPASAEVVGIPASEFVDGRKCILDLVKPSDQPAFISARDEATKNTQIIPLRHSVFHSSGRTMQVETELFALDEGNGAKIVGSMRSVDAIVDAQDQKNRAEYMKAQGMIAAELAHNFNNIFAIIKVASTNLLRSVAVASSAAERVNVINDAASRGGVLIKSLLAPLGRNEELVDRCDINEIIKSNVPQFECAAGNACAVSLSVSDQKIVCRLNERSFIDSIVNIASNARDAGAKNFTIVVEAVDLWPHNPVLKSVDLPSGRYGLISFIDDGSGMAPEIVANAFNPFFSTKEQLGRGLGLSFLYNFVRSANGAVEIKSAPGSGSKLMIYLPITAEREPEQIKGTHYDVDASEKVSNEFK